jgi:hypothetical protein
MAGPKRQYDIDIDTLPAYDELVERLGAAGVGPQAAEQAAGWVELRRAGITRKVSHVTEIRYRRHLCAAMGVPVPPKPGKAYEDQAEPLRDAGLVDLATTAGLAAMAGAAVLATVHPIGFAVAAPIMCAPAGYDDLAAAA